MKIVFLLVCLYGSSCLLFSQKLLVSTQVETIIPVSSTKKYYTLGAGLNFDIGISILGKLDLLFSTGFSIVFDNKKSLIEQFGIEGPAFLLPTLGKLRYNLIKGPIKPYVSVSTGVINSFKVANEQRSSFAIKPSVGIIINKLILDASYTYAEDIGANIPLRSFNFGLGLPF